MKNTIRILAGALSALTLLTACGAAGQTDTALNITSDTLAVERVEGLSDDFILGMDASCVPALERSGVRYRDHEGVETDVFEILSRNGINYIRVRVWNDPYDDEGRGYGGGNCDIDNAVTIGRRATANGMKLMVDFHYSDFWADPGKQMVPNAWAELSYEKKREALYTFTRDSLLVLLDAGVDVGMVQLGNETNGSLCGESAADPEGWQRITGLLSAGAQAVREVCPGALIAVHFTNPEKSGTYETYGKYLAEYGVDYDVFASSYYPYWHGTLENLSAVLSQIGEKYGKKVMVAETSYAYTTRDTDYYGNTVGSGSALEGYPFTAQGQADLVRDVVDTIANHTVGGIGVCYWEGTWISVGGSSWEENSALWERFGSGWASSFAAGYDPEDAGQWYGGCAVDNQAFFDETGQATEALKVFALLRTGNTVPRE